MTKPYAKRFQVLYDHNEQAWFSKLDDAHDFARSKDGDVFAKDGIIGQYRNGMATPEFLHLDN